jgi:uncharacterized membrane-anchored protein
MYQGSRIRMLACLFLAILSSWSLAEEPAEGMTEEQFLASLQFQQGNITLPNKIASINLPDNFRYLAPADAERVLVDAWGNPPGYETLGMIVPATPSLLDPAGWGVVVTYDEDGHVADDEARTMDYEEILQGMKEQTAANNEQRKADGFPAMTLVGWAEQPRYDSNTHKFFWAKELSVEGADTHTLNYNIRVLGRQGVLVLNAVAGMDNVNVIREQMPSVVTATEFTPGNRYSDFNSATDKVAEYGLAALLAGGVAAKTGLLGKLMALALAFKKFIVIGLLAIGSLLSRVFGKKAA